MNRKALIIAGALPIALAAGLAYTVLRSGPHAFTEEQCRECHAVTPVKGRRETMRLTAPVAELCAGCHKAMEDSISHPVEMTPARAVPPPDFPLSFEGKMTCTTCHDIHESSAQVFGAATSFLRRGLRGRELCIVCHQEESAGHMTMMPSTHMRYRADQAEAGRIDPISHTCLSCHDGSLGPMESVSVGTWEHGAPLAKFDPSGSHPIGVDYLRAFARRRGLKPIGSLNPAIKLIDGKVGCSSCHDLFSKLPGRLVMSNSGSRLCLACHDK